MHFRISYTMNAEDIFRSSIGCEIMLMIKTRIRLIFSRYTTTELSILLTSCLTAIKTMSLNIAQQFMKEMVKIYFGLLKIQMKYLIN